MISRPQPEEYAQFSANYIALASRHDDVIALLHKLKNETYRFLLGLAPERGDYAYAPGKWTLKQVVGHMVDAERVFGYRAFCISRGEQKHMPSFEQNDYIDAVDYNSRTLASLAEEFRSVRESNMFFIERLTSEQIARSGAVSDYHPTVRAILYIMAGHELYHLEIIKEKYL